MPDEIKPFYMVNSGAELTVFRAQDDHAWFRIRAKDCGGSTIEEKTAQFKEAVKHQRAAFAASAGYRETREPALPGI